MIIPVRCISCGRVISEDWEKYNELLKKGKSEKEALDELGITRYCCRAHIISHKPLVEDIARFKDKIIPNKV